MAVMNFLIPYLLRPIKVLHKNESHKIKEDYNYLHDQLNEIFPEGNINKMRRLNSSDKR